MSLMVKSGTWNSLPYVSSSLPYSLGSPAVSEAREESEVEEAEGRGESTGDTSVVDGDESESTATRLTACLVARRPVDVAEAILVSLGV